jgi:hypothetical protein
LRNKKRKYLMEKINETERTVRTKLLQTYREAENEFKKGCLWVT